MKTSTIALAVVNDSLLIRQHLSILRTHNDICVLFHAETLKQTELHMQYGRIPEIIVVGHLASELKVLEALRFFKREAPQIRCIVLCDRLRREFVLEALSQGAKAILSKTTPPEETIKAICDIYHKGFYYNSSVTRIVTRQSQLLANAVNAAQFTRRESQLLGLLCSGKSSKQIATLLNISLRTVEGHRQQILKRTGCKSIAGLKRLLEL